jgi:hypothetical protein
VPAILSDLNSSPDDMVVNGKPSFELATSSGTPIDVNIVEASYNALYTLT